MTLKALLDSAVKLGASDLLLKAGARPALRVHGRLRFLDAPPITPDFAQQALAAVADEERRRVFERRGEVDLSYEEEGVGRFRVNIFRQQGFVSLVCRHVKYDIPSLKELRLPQRTLENMVTQPRGLILVTGVTGSGKSTTLAAMIEHLNQTQSKHVVTIEDPIEYVYADKKCLIDQRQLREDTMSYASAMRHVVRQAPDVILIGEMRDRETMDAAINAAETGHLVLSTLHTVNASQTVERMINFFPPHQHEFIRLQLSLLLVGSISQRLVPTADGKGRAPAVEILANSPRVRELLREGQTIELYHAMKEGDFYGMQTFNQSLIKWIKAGVVKLEDAVAASDDPDELRLELEGVTLGGRRSDTLMR